MSWRLNERVGEAERHGHQGWATRSSRLSDTLGEAYRGCGGVVQSGIRVGGQLHYCIAFAFSRRWVRGVSSNNYSIILYKLLYINILNNILTTFQHISSSFGFHEKEMQCNNAIYLFFLFLFFFFHIFDCFSQIISNFADIRTNNSYEQWE